MYKWWLYMVSSATTFFIKFRMKCMLLGYFDIYAYVNLLCLSVTLTTMLLVVSIKNKDHWKYLSGTFWKGFITAIIPLSVQIHCQAIQTIKQWAMYIKICGKLWWSGFKENVNASWLHFSGFLFLFFFFHVHA